MNIQDKNVYVSNYARIWEFIKLNQPISRDKVCKHFKKTAHYINNPQSCISNMIYIGQVATIDELYTINARLITIGDTYMPSKTFKQWLIKQKEKIMNTANTNTNQNVTETSGETKEGVPVSFIVPSTSFFEAAINAVTSEPKEEPVETKTQEEPPVFAKPDTKDKPTEEPIPVEKVFTMDFSEAQINEINSFANTLSSYFGFVPTPKQMIAYMMKTSWESYITQSHQFPQKFQTNAPFSQSQWDNPNTPPNSQGIFGQQKMDSFNKKK